MRERERFIRGLVAGESDRSEKIGGDRRVRHTHLVFLAALGEPMRYMGG